MSKNQLPPPTETRPEEVSKTNGHSNGQSQYDIVPLTKLKIDHATDGGYARPVSEDRLKKLRKSWKLSKAGTIHVNKRPDGSLWLIDGQHRVEIAQEKGVEDVILVPVPKDRDVLVALVHSTADPSEEADLYLGYADAMPQQALSQFQAQLRRGDREALAIKAAVESVGLKIGVDYSMAHADDGTVIAINRLERMHVIGGGSGLRETLILAKESFGMDHRAYQQAMLEALFQFWAAYHTQYDRDRLVARLKEVGVEGITSRAYAIKSHGEWPRTVDALIAAIWRVYHEPKLRSHRLPMWSGRRAKQAADGTIKPFAQGTRSARIEKARQERKQLSVVGE